MNGVIRAFVEVAAAGIIGASSLSGQDAAATGRPWWHVPTPVVSHPQEIKDFSISAAGAARNAGYPSGWYGYWYINDQDRMGHSKRVLDRVGKAGLKRVIYFDSGEVGDYAAFFTADGKMVHNGWSLPWWKGEPVTARWFGLQAFMAGVPWAPWPTAKAYGLPEFTFPDGSPAGDRLYDTLVRRPLNGKWEFDFYSNERVTDEMAQMSGLAAISAPQKGKDDVRGKSGWRTTRLLDVDFANPQLRDFRCRELARMIEMVRPEGVHIDNHGDVNILYPERTAFGEWAVRRFPEWLKAHASPERLRELGIADPGRFDIRQYVNTKLAGTEGKPGQRSARLKDPAWTQDPVWLAFLIAHTEWSIDFHRAVHRAGKDAAARAGLDLLVCGNTIPIFPGRPLMRGACDIANFECRSEGRYGPYRATGLPPWGRIGALSRLGAAMGDCGYSWPSQYVPKRLSGVGHENLHAALAFDALANRGLLDFGHWYLDGYSPGTEMSAGRVNRFVRANAALLVGRRYLADVGVIYSTWSEIATITALMPLTERFADEYAGWAAFLDHAHCQWDLVLAEDISAEALARYPVIVLPSVAVLTDDQAAALRRYVEAGGRLVATGDSGARQGPGGWLMPRTQNALEALRGNPRAHVDAARPGADYWNKERDPAAAARLRELVAFDGSAPVLETDAPQTVSMQLNQSADGKTMTLDLVNFDIDPETDARRRAPACRVAIRGPREFHGRALRAVALVPGGGPAPSIAAPEAAGDGQVRVGIPSFDDFLLVRIE